MNGQRGRQYGWKAPNISAYHPKKAWASTLESWTRIASYERVFDSKVPK